MSVQAATAKPENAAGGFFQHSQNKKLEVQEGLKGEGNVHVTADSEFCIGFLRKDRNLVWAILRGKIRVRGSLKLFQAFAKCFLA